MQSFFPTPLFHDLRQRLSKGHGPLAIAGLCGCAPALVVAELARSAPQQLLLITADQTSADELTRGAAVLWHAAPGELSRLGRTSL